MWGRARGSTSRAMKIVRVIPVRQCFDKKSVAWAMPALSEVGLHAFRLIAKLRERNAAAMKAAARAVHLRGICATPQCADCNYLRYLSGW
jgi:hypothetical protein